MEITETKEAVTKAPFSAWVGIYMRIQKERRKDVG